MYTSQTATTTALIGDITADGLQVIVIAIGIILGIAVLLAGVGYTWRKLRSKAIGRNF